MAFKDYPANASDVTTIGDGIFIGPNMARQDVRPALQTLAADGRNLYSEMAGMTVAGMNYRATLAQGVSDFAVGEYFLCPETGALRMYQRTGVAPYYVDQGDASAPLTRASAGAPSGASLVGFTRPETGAVPTTLQARGRLVLHAEDFGVANSLVADSTTAYQKALDAASATGLELRLPPNMMHGAVTVASNVSIVGQSAKTNVVATAGAYNLYTMTGSDITIRNLSIQASGKVSGWEFIIACGTTARDRIFLENIVTYNSKGLLTDSGTGAGVHTTTLVEQVQAKSHAGPGVQLTRLFAFGWFTRVVVDYAGVSASNFTGFYFNLTGLGSAAGGLNLIDCDVLGTLGAFSNATQRGFDIQNAAAIWIINCRADTVCEIGWVFYNVNLIDASGLVASLVGSHGVWLEIVTNSKFRGCGIFGRNYLASPPANCDGIRFVTGCANVSISESLIRDWTGHGVDKTAAQVGAVTISGNQLLANTGRGSKSVGNSGWHVVSSTFGGNTAGNYDHGGTSDLIQACQLTSGASSGVVAGVAAA